MVRAAFAFRLVTEVRFDFIEVPPAPAGLETPGVAVARAARGGSSPPSSQAATGHGCGGMQRSRHGIRHARSLTFLASSGRRLGRKPAGPSLSGVMPTRGILLEDGRRLHGSLGRRCAVRQGAAHGPRSSEEAASAHRRCGLQASSSLFMAPATSGPSSVRPYAIIPGQTLSAGAGRSIVPNQGSASKNPAATRNDAPK
jgi:hypothetical protein